MKAKYMFTVRKQNCHCTVIEKKLMGITNNIVTVLSLKKTYSYYKLMEAQLLPYFNLSLQ